MRQRPQGFTRIWFQFGRRFSSRFKNDLTDDLTADFGQVAINVR